VPRPAAYPEEDTLGTPGGSQGAFLQVRPVGCTIMRLRSGRRDGELLEGPRLVGRARVLNTEVLVVGASRRTRAVRSSLVLPRRHCGTPNMSNRIVLLNLKPLSVLHHLQDAD
jgi:hypothetical protein